MKCRFLSQKTNASFGFIFPSFEVIIHITEGVSVARILLEGWFVIRWNVFAIKLDCSIQGSGRIGAPEWDDEV